MGKLMVPIQELPLRAPRRDSIHPRYAFSMSGGIKAIWLDAIRREKVFDSRYLRTGQDIYSSMGILCKVYHATTGKGQWQKSPAGPYNFADISDISGQIPPHEVYSWTKASIDYDYFCQIFARFAKMLSPQELYDWINYWVEAI